MTSQAASSAAEMLPGWVATFYTTYNGKREGPYHVRRWKKNRKLYKEYIKPNDLGRVRAACEAHRQKRKRQIACNRELTTVTGNLNYVLRMVKRSIKGALRPTDHDFLAILEKQGVFSPGRPSLRTARNFMVPPPTKALPASVGEEPRSGDGGVRHPAYGATRDFMVPSFTNHNRSEIRDPRSDIKRVFIAPALTKPLELTPQAPVSDLGSQPSALSNVPVLDDGYRLTTPIPDPEPHPFAITQADDPLGHYDITGRTIDGWTTIWDPKWGRG